MDRTASNISLLLLNSSLSVLQVQASDPGCANTERGDSLDGTPLVYSTSAAANLPVTVRRHTGYICLSAALDYDTAPVYEFNITATDQGHLYFHLQLSDNIITRHIFVILKQHSV